MQAKASLTARAVVPIEETSALPMTTSSTKQARDFPIISMKYTPNAESPNRVIGLIKERPSRAMVSNDIDNMVAC